METRTGKTGSAPASISRTHLLLVFVLAFFLCQGLYLPNDALADTQTKYPTGDNSATGTWTITGAASRWQAVSEVAADDATTIITGTAIGNALFNFSAFTVPAGSTITNLTVYYRASKAAAQASNIRASIRVNGTNYDTTDAGVNPSQTPTYTSYSFAYATNPNTGAAWTVADINGTGVNPLQAFGVYSSDIAPTPYVTQVYAVVTYTLPNGAPALSISQPDGTGDTVTVGQSYNITYSLSDAEEVVTAAFYYDTDNTGLNGTAITGPCATAPEGANVTCAWDTTGMTPGTYYVYGISNDGVNPASSAYSGGMITINAAAGAGALLHNSVNTSSTKHAADGGWGIAGTRFGQFTCDTCHTKSTTNIKRIRTAITTPDTSKGTLPGNNQPIVFSKTSGAAGDAGVMGDDSTTPRATSNKICEICHTYDATSANGTKVHPYNSLGATINVSSHQNNSKDCIQCHKHSQGFKKAACDSCHGNPPTVATAGGPNGLANSPYATGSTTAGAHSKHVSAPLGFDCTNCHNNYVMPQESTVKPGFGDISIGFSNFGSTTGSYSGQSNVSYNNTLGTGTKTCSTNYCHGSTINPVVNPVWDAAAGAYSCGTSPTGACHPASAANPPTLGSHTRHVVQVALACSACHGPTAGATGHVDGSVAWSLDATDTRIDTAATYSGAASGTSGSRAPSASYKTCSSTYCHSQGYSNTAPYPAPNITAAWGGTLDNTCTGCHGGNAAAGTKMATNAHNSHINDTANKVGRNLGCGECHSATVTSGNDRSISGAANHVNKLLNIKFDNSSINKDADAPTYNTGSTTGPNGGTAAPGSQAACSNVYCHSVGNLADTTGSGAVVAVGGTSFRTISWNTGTIDCTGCHGTSGTKSHPDYATGAAGSTTANSHVKHVENNFYSCDYCHNTTTTDTAVYPALPTAVTAGGQHLNRIETVSFKSVGAKTGTYNGAVTFKTCATTYCHGSATPQWGGSVACNSCHEATNSGTGLSARHIQHYNSASVPADRSNTNSHTTTAYVFGCGNCHPNGSTHATGPADAVGPVLQDAEISLTGKITAFSQGGSSALDSQTYNYTVGSTCTTLCHTRDGATPGSAVVAQNWGTTPTNTCGVCHNKAGDAAPAWSAPHTLHINTYSANTNITCNACHTGTAANNTTLQATAAARNQHPDTVKNVELNTWVVSGGTGTWSASQCSNTYCHSAGTAFTSPTHLPLSWSGNTTCASCHTGGTATGPSYPNGAPKTNSHSKHVVAKGYACVDCHSGTVNGANAITGYANHVNKNYDVAGALITSYTYSNTGGTCATSCHASTTPKWGQTSGGCTFCHPTLSGKHSSHVILSDTSTYGNTSVNYSGSATNYDFGCGNCHPVNTANHMNGTVELSLNPADGGTLKSKNAAVPTITGSGLTTQCNGVYCHSDGKATPTYVQTPQWQSAYASSLNTCGNCHGNSPSGTNHQAHVVGIHSDTIYSGTTGLQTAGTATFNSHGNSAYSTTINCNICHYGTVTKSRNKYGASCLSCHTEVADATNSLVTADTIKTMHVNGQPDVAFQAVNVKSKAQVRDDITTVAELNTNWTRTAGNYKLGATPYDLAKNALNTGTMWNGVSKTCSNIACHNGNSVTWTGTVTCDSCHTQVPQ